MTRVADQLDGIYVINLPERLDRREQTLVELESVDLLGDGSKVQFFPAVKPQDAGPFESLGAHGCFLSHVQVMAQALADGHERVLILEDDVEFTAQWTEYDAQIAQKLAAKDWGALYLGYLDKSAAESDFSWVPPHAELQGTHCIAWSRKSLEVAVPYLQAMYTRPAGDPEGGPMPIDGAFNWLRRQHPEQLSLMALPPLATQRSSRSDITPSALDSFAISRIPLDLYRWAKRTLGAKG